MCASRAFSGWDAAAPGGVLQKERKKKLSTPCCTRGGHASALCVCLVLQNRTRLRYVMGVVTREHMRSVV